jgi:hypothetical protein
LNEDEFTNTTETRVTLSSVEEVMKHVCSLNSATWKDLYAQALFEADRAKVATRIARAESEIVSRARELFSTEGQNSDERKALDRALHMLQVLKTCHQTGATEHLVA